MSTLVAEKPSVKKATVKQTVEQAVTQPTEQPKIQKQRIKNVEELKKDFGEKFLSFIPVPYHAVLGMPLDGLIDSLQRHVKTMTKNIWTYCTQSEYDFFLKEKAEKDATVKTLSEKVSNEGNITFTFGDGTYHSSSYNFTIYMSPTHNCQLMSIGSFDQLLSRLPIEKIENILQHVQLRCGKRLLFFDVKHTHLPMIERLFFEKMNVNKYKSTNGSHMVQGMLVLRPNKYYGIETR
jgi:hypothetical protein